jgi:hypothetical protein
MRTSQSWLEQQHQIEVQSAIEAVSDYRDNNLRVVEIVRSDDYMSLEVAVRLRTAIDKKALQGKVDRNSMKLVEWSIRKSIIDLIRSRIRIKTINVVVKVLVGYWVFTKTIEVYSGEVAGHKFEYANLDMS